jgi:hypothetical protein
LITYGKSRQQQVLEGKDVYDYERDALLPIIHQTWKTQVKSSRDQHVGVLASPACPESHGSPPNDCKDNFHQTESQESRTMEECIQMAHNVSNPDANIGLKRSTTIPEHEDAAWVLTELDPDERAPEQENFSSNRQELAQILAY